MSTQVIDFNNVDSVVFDGKEVETLKLNDTIIWEGFKKLNQLIDRTIEIVTAEDLEGITTIGDHAFATCNNLTEITIPSTVTSIGSSAFSGSGLQTIRLLSTTPPTVSSDAIPTTITRIEVPSTSLTIYKNDTSWVDFANKMVGV